MVAAKYTYLVCDLLTDEPICFLPFRGVTFDHRFNQAGVFNGSVPIVNRTLSAYVDKVMPRDEGDLSSGVGRVICHVLRHTREIPVDLWGSYWLWRGRVGQSRRGAPVAEFQGMSLDGFLHQAEVQEDLEWIAEDKAQIVRDLLTHAQSQPNLDLGIALQGGLRGYGMDFAVKSAEAAKYGERVNEVANSDGGIEHRVRTYLSGETRVREWQWGAPIGGIVPIEEYAQPGNVLEWSEEDDATRAATRWRARGDSVNTDLSAESQPLITEPVEATDHLLAGWPRTDKTANYPGVDEISTLNNYATYWAAVAPGKVRISTLTVRLPDNPRLTPHTMGEHVRVRLVNERYPLADGVASYVRSKRVIGMQIKPAERGGQEEAVLVQEQVVS